MTSMRRPVSVCRRAASVAITLIAATALLGADTVHVRHTEGLVPGFLVLKTLDGATIANGDLIQLANGTRVTRRLRLQFTDGSLQDESTVFSQRNRFQFVSDRLVQRGPSFPTPLEMQLHASGAVRVRYTDQGEQKEERDRLDPRLPRAAFHSSWRRRSHGW